MCEYDNYFFYNSIIAPLRSERPMIGVDNTNCPFCEANEKDLEGVYEEVWEKENLFVRILANRYPIIPTHGNNAGSHDVIVDTNHHLEHPRDFSLKHWEVLLLTIQKRWRMLSSEGQIAFIHIFKNYGVLAGASIHHSHWQLVAMTKVPLGMVRQYEKYHRQNTCFLCEKGCLNKGIVIKETLLWKTIVPPTPEYNYEVWLVPKVHRQHFGELENSEIAELGYLLKQVLISYHYLLPNCSFNICMMNGDLRKQWHYHFHIRLMIRIGHIAGFEIATHCHILIEEPVQYAVKIKQLLQE